MDFILEEQAQITVNMDKLQAADERAALRLDRLERFFKLATRIGLRERRSRREQDGRIAALVGAQLQTGERIAALADTQRQSDERINRLALIVEKIATKGNGTE